MNTSMIDIQGMTKQYKKFTFGPIDFKVEAGTAVAIIGANGSGKTTFFRMMMNLLQTDVGSIRFFGKKLSEEETEIKKQIGYAGELLEPFHYLTIKDLSSLISYWYSNWDHQQYKYLLERYNIDESQKYGKCSKGTKKKVEFVFSLCHEAKLLLLDEPSAGVDMISQQKMKEDLMNYMEDGERSIVLATHNIDEVKQLCDFITIIDNGKLISTMNKDDIHDKWARLWVSHLLDEEHPHILKVEETPPQIITDHLPLIEKELEERGISISHSNRLSLEEVVEHLISRGQQG
ncbi:ABC transporter ATP-binding protein [Bacillus alkalicellulosilyticus]|uniref:ABC transporter ATP-binding protein n=1 Tax=Alkalihalobacterium alkalicellulosilyticum TaxID=1912214 RepID=UPI001482C41D|nr:ABC transporter ATP-binding protein [Bacillus alkalicellulosilyticus]